MGNSGLRAETANDQADVTRLVRSDLRVIFARMMADAGLNQTRAAKVCFTDQPTLSKVLSGRSDSVSTEQMLKWLVQLGCRVEISVRRPDGLGAGAIRAALDE